MRPRRVLVTGADGFVAAALLPLLRRRFALVLGATRKTAELSDPAQAARLVRRARPDLVFHLAGSRGADPGALWRDNVASTLALGAALRREVPGARFVLAGSSAVDAADTPYGRAKRAATHAALSFVPEGLDVRIGVLYNLCGPGTPESLAPGAWAAQIARLERHGGGNLLHGNLAAERDFLDVRDAADALLRLGTTPGLNGRYDVGSGRGVPMSKVLRCLLDATKSPVRPRRDPRRLRVADTKTSVASPSHLARSTGWRPRIPLGRSLADTLAWHRSR